MREVEAATTKNAGGALEANKVSPLRSTADFVVPRRPLRALKLRDRALGKDHVLVPLRESRVCVKATQKEVAVGAAAHVTTPSLEAPSEAADVELREMAPTPTAVKQKKPKPKRKKAQVKPAPATTTWWASLLEGAAVLAEHPERIVVPEAQHYEGSRVLRDGDSAFVRRKR